MMLLLDQNLSQKLVSQLSAEFPGSMHVRDLRLATESDSAVWKSAAAQGLMFVSNDVDFQQRALLLGHSPKVIWIRLGNCRTDAIATLLRTHRAAIEEFSNDPKASFIALA